MDLKEKIAEVLAGVTNLEKDKVLGLLEVPPSPELGDYAFPCFLLVKKLKKAPPMIATELAEKISADFIESVTAVGPYINIKLDKKTLANQILSKITEEIKISVKKPETICLESPGPNTNKPLHLGHIRNMLLGVSLRNILRKIGHKVIPVDVVNDRGIHICKAILAYQMFGKGKTPESEGIKGDLFVGNYYIKFAQEVKNNPELEDNARDLLVKWENNDPETKKLWKTMRDWCLLGFKKTYADYGVYVTKAYFESDTYLEGKKAVLDGVEKGIFKKNEAGAVIVDLEKQGLGEKVLLRHDGTTIYITQDIQLAKERFDDYHMDRMIYVVGSEQEYHFKVLFEVLKIMGYPFAKKCYHLSYGMVNLPDGKMKSREGTVVDADDFRKNLIALAKEEVKERYKDLSEEELNRRAEIIAVGAINFFVLKFDALKDFVYDSKKSLSFTGESGPYVQYAHARICSIIRKAGKKIGSVDLSLLKEDSEKNLILKLGIFEELVLTAAENYKPSLVANYLLDLAQMFNSYYHDTQVLVKDEELAKARLYLIDKVRIILKEGLALLNIQAPEEM